MFFSRWKTVGNSWNAVRLMRRIIVLLFTWGLQVDLSSFSRVEWSLSVEWITEGIDNTSEDFWTDWNIDDSTSSLDGITFFDESIVTENDNTNVVSFQVQGLVIFFNKYSMLDSFGLLYFTYHTLDTGGEFNHFLGLDVSKTMDTSNTVTNSQDLTSFFKITG